MTEARGGAAVQHPTDGELLELLDGEAGAAAPRLRRHLTRCARCGWSLEALRAISGVVEDATGASRPPTHTRRPRRTYRSAGFLTTRPAQLRAAAMVIVLVGVGFGVPPVRAWVFGLAGVSPPAPGVLDPPSVARDDQPVRERSAVSFPFADSVFRVHITTRQATGSLALVRSEGLSVTGEIVGNRREVEMLVAAAGLWLDNTATATADYRLRLPAAVHAVHVLMGAEPVRVVDARDLAGVGTRLNVGSFDPNP